MAEIKANGLEITECGDTIVTLADKYISQINSMFLKLSHLNESVWSGPTANTYVQSVISDKQSFVEFGEYLKMYGKVIQNIGVNVDRIVDKWENKK